MMVRLPKIGVVLLALTGVSASIGSTLYGQDRLSGPSAGDRESVPKEQGVLREPFVRPVVILPYESAAPSERVSTGTVIKYSLAAGAGYVAGVLMCAFIGGEDNESCTLSILVGVLAGVGIASAF